MRILFTMGSPFVILIASLVILGAHYFVDGFTIQRVGLLIVAHIMGAVALGFLGFTAVGAFGFAATERRQSDGDRIAPTSAATPPHMVDLPRGNDLIRVSCTCNHQDTPECELVQDERYQEWARENVRQGRYLPLDGRVIFLNGQEIPRV